MSDDDFEELAGIRVAAMRESLERLGRFDPERARARLLVGFAPQHTHFILIDGERAGFYVARFTEEGLALEHLYILPCFQNRGAGARVLGLIAAQADAQGAAVRVGALKESDSNRFYLRHGFVFERAGEFDNYYVRPAPGALA